jgi:hypothetical protein
MGKTQPRAKDAVRPEKKFGPYAGGIGVAIWCNTAETTDGPKQFRSLTISPRRYRDEKNDKWRDSSGFRPSDIATLQFALSQAQAYILTTPLPGAGEEGAAAEGDETEF